MKSLSALTREFRIAYYETALQHLQQRDPTHADIPAIVRHLHTLRGQRPPIEKKPRSRCEAVPGMCARDRACPDRHCPGLYQDDGGHQVHGHLSFPIEPGAAS